MLFEFFNHARLNGSTTIEETFDSVKLTAKLNEGTSAFVLKLFDELKTLSNRDSFELFVELDGNHEKFFDCSASSFSRLKQHLQEYEGETKSEVVLDIRKAKVDSAISIYFIQEFGQYLSNEILLDAINTFSENLKEPLKFEVFSTIDNFGSTRICFVSAGKLETDTLVANEPSRQEKLELFAENANSANIKITVLPSDFYLTTQSQHDEINDFFKRACSVLSLAFTANSSELKKDDRFSYKICGYKAVICNGVTSTELAQKYQLLYRIYAWAYEGGNNPDKLGLVRNVISIHLDDSGNVRIDRDVWDAIQSNYQIYLKGNIQSYLEVKNKIGEFIIESTTKTYAMADELLDSLKNNAFILLTFLLTVVVVNGLKDTGEITVFSNAYLAIVIILSIISGLWLAMTRTEVMKRFDSAASTISSVLKLNYNKVLMESEIDECVNPVIETNRNYLQSQVKRYTRWWVGMLIVFVVSFVICNHLLIPKAKSENVAASTPDGFGPIKPTIPEETRREYREQGQVPQSSRYKVARPHPASCSLSLAPRATRCSSSQ